VPSKITGYSTTDTVAPLKGSNPSGNVASDKAQSDASTATATAQTGDQVTLTSSARSLQKLSAAIAQAPLVNASKVASIKQALDSGTYKVNAASVADKLLQFENGLK
jgi:negative regulator of flagellin synthesis FlgM